MASGAERPQLLQGISNVAVITASKELSAPASPFVYLVRNATTFPSSGFSPPARNFSS
jgi:hypothetical protein